MRLNYQLGLSLQQNDQAPLTGLFQRLNRIIPEDQQLQILPSDTPVQQALEQMKRKGFSQIPISDGGEIMGVFSYRSFALGVLRFEDNKTNVLNLTVSDFSEDLPFKNLTDPFEDVIDDLDRRDAVLVGRPEKLTAIVSAMDILRYLYGVTSPFVVVAEIELAVRALMTWSANTVELRDSFRKSLSKIYQEPNFPATVDELSFSDYASVIGYDDSWRSYFEPIFGSTRTNVRAKLTRVAEIRNRLFHFRQEITVEEFDELVQVRDWLLKRSKMNENKQPKPRLEVA